MFAGLFAYHDAPPPEVWVDTNVWRQILSPFVTPDIVGHWQEGNALLVETKRFNTPWSHFTTEAPYREDHLSVVFWGRLDNRTELAQQLGIDTMQLGTLPDAQIVRAAWQRWGEALPERLQGDFALAVVDADHRRMFLARDPLGVKPLYYWPHAQGLLFATTVSAFRCLKKLKPAPDNEWMARYLLHLSMSHDRTGYEEILKLPAGHCLSVDGEGRFKLRRWHEWREDAPAASRRELRWLEDYREILEKAIRCRMASDYPLGTENSGGIDSASITAYLARFLGEPGDRLHSFGFAMCKQEPEFILKTSRETGITHNYVLTAREVSRRQAEERIDRGLRVLGYPEEHADATGHMPFYCECISRGIRTLFSGFGGDEVVTNPGGHLRCELLDQRRYAALWDILPGNPVTRLLRLGKAMVRGYPRPEYNPNFLRAWNERWPHQPLRPEVVARLGLHEIYMETARYDAPYRRVDDWIINGLLRMPYVPTRLENCTLVADSYGVDYCWPLWDVRLVQQYLSTPGIEKVGPKGIGRYLHRRAISGTVPHKVAWKPSKDMGYASVHQAMQESGIIKIAEFARREDALLHPALTELLDQPKWRGQIGRAAQGKVPAEFGFFFRRTTQAVRWLNRWLHGKNEY
jgi:asparagine synthase (glutamine-hydrolysing)